MLFTVGKIGNQETDDVIYSTQFGTEYINEATSINFLQNNWNLVHL